MTVAGEQLSMALPASPQGGTDRLWLGLALDHWQLFDALQDEWLKPPEGGAGRLLGVRGFAGRRDAADNRITAHIKIDPARLPRLEAPVRRGGQWTNSPIHALHAGDEAIVWPGALPAFAISEILVATGEQQARLLGLARQVSNVALPEDALGIHSGDVPWVDVDASVPSGDALPEGLALPLHMDAARGATAMALWAVPRIDPWLDILAASLAPSPRLQPLAAAVDAPWWAWPPWLRLLPDATRAAGLQERLWLAAAGVFRDLRLRDATGAEDIVSEIAAAAASDDSEPDSAALQAWADETRSILRADTTIHLGDWKSAPVGKAIQLVLARPEPARFKGWLDDQPALSPAVWWSAATLCGLIHGYRRLDMQFRGDAAQRRLLAVHAASASVAPEPMWSDAPTAAPRWRRDSGRFVLSWAGTDFASKLEHPRGRWYGADMGAPDVRRAAREMSRRLGWPCLHRELVVADDTLALAGPGEIEVTSEPSRSVAVRGKVRVRLPSQTVLEDIVDADEFRRCLVTEGGAHIPEPPTPRGPVLGHPEVPGLLYTPEFLSPSEEAELVARLDRAEWLPDLQRRVQHYGWRYNYKARQVDASMRLGPLPPWAKQLAQRLAARGLLPHLADQVIVNEYCGKQGISKHVDCAPCFADGVAMISLLESWEMVFKEQRGGRKVPHRLERRSVAVMTGDARYRWTHEIPKRLTEPGGVRRQRRISVTFRKVNETAARSYGR